MFNSKSRAYNSVLNAITGVGGQLITIVISFIVRTVFIAELGKIYLGINGLFTNIISVLSLTDLGIGIAINYSLYKIIAEKNREKVIDYMNIYKNIYRVIALTVFFLGLCVIPFFDFIIKDKPDISENIIFIYLLYLFNSSMSFLFVYKRSIILADQKYYIYNLIHTIVFIVFNAFQILFLIVFKSFTLYLCIQIAVSLVSNIVLSIMADRMYPFIKEKGSPLSKAEKRELFTNVRALIVYRVSDTVCESTDNIFISRLFGLSNVGVYSNYHLITATIQNIVKKILDAATASVGNLNAKASAEKNEEVFTLYNFITFWIYCFTSTCFLCLFQPFIRLWIGDGFLLSNSAMICIVFLYYVAGLMVPVTNYRTALGLFKQGQIRPLFMVIGNIVFSLLFIKLFGIAGVFIGTIVARLLIQAWFDPWVIYRYGFKLSVRKYYINYVKYMFVFIPIAAVTYYLCNRINSSGIIGFIYITIVCLTLPNILMSLIFIKTNEFRTTINIVINTVTNIIKKGRPSSQSGLSHKQ